MRLSKYIVIVLLIFALGYYFYAQSYSNAFSLNVSNATSERLPNQPTVPIGKNIESADDILTAKRVVDVTGPAETKAIVRCNKDWFYGHNKTALKNDHSEYLTLISKSNTDEDKFTLLLQSPAEHEISDIFNLNTLSLHKPLIYDRKLTACLKNFDAKNCNDSLYQQAQNIDKDNAYLWHLIAAIHFSQNNIPKAITALKTANTKAYFNNYFFETVSFIEQKMQTNSAITFNSRLISGLGVAAAKPGVNYSHLIRYCKNNLDDTDIAELCLQTGIELEKKSKSLMSYLLGLAIQKLNYQHDFKTDLLNEIILKEKKYQNNYVSNADYDAMTSLMFFDENLGRTWLNAALAKGEAFGISKTIEEAKIFSQNKDYQPCP